MKSKIIMILILIFSCIDLAFAIPTLKNCGNSTVDSYCSNSGCRIDVDPSNAIQSCELDFDTAQQPYFITACWQNYIKGIRFEIMNGNSVMLYPQNYQTSLKGDHIYLICMTSTTQGR